MFKKYFLTVGLLMLALNTAQAQTAVFAAKAKEVQFYDVVESVATAKAYDSVTITPEVSSKLTDIHVVEGQKVQKGDLLFTLNNKEELADLNAARSTFFQKEKAFKRAKPLLEDKVISDATYQERESDYLTAKAQVESVSARLDLLEIKAPFAGSVGIIDMSVGTFVQAGEPMVNLSNLDKMKVDFFVPSRYLSVLQVGDVLQAQSSAYDDVFEGRLAFVDQQVDVETRTVRVRAIVDNPQGQMKDGMFMTVKIKANPRKALTIPEESVVKTGTENYVYVIQTKDDQQVVAKRPVEIGKRLDGELEILKGLKADEIVVHHGVMKVRDGAAVQVQFVEENNETLDQMLQGKGQ